MNMEEILRKQIEELQKLLALKDQHISELQAKINSQYPYYHVCNLFCGCFKFKPFWSVASSTTAPTDGFILSGSVFQNDSNY